MSTMKREVVPATVFLICFSWWYGFGAPVSFRPASALLPQQCFSTGVPQHPEVLQRVLRGAAATFMSEHYFVLNPVHCDSVRREGEQLIPFSPCSYKYYCRQNGKLCRPLTRSYQPIMLCWTALQFSILPAIVHMAAERRVSVPWS